MVTTSDSPTDSVYTSRRVAYSYSSDGGKHWKSPVIVGNVRLGFPSIILYKRAGVNVPIIAAHNGPNTGQTNWVTHVYIEQGNPGDGNFKLYAADRNASDGLTKDIGYPLMALSPNQDTLYVLGCPLQATTTTPPDNLEFGKYALGTVRDAKWLGWVNQPGGNGMPTAPSAGGADVLRIAPNGNIGVLWVQGSIDDRGLYYVESADAGNTWTTNYGRLYTPDASGAAGGVLADYDGLDFFFDQKSNPHYIWQADYQFFSNNTFLPYSAMIFSWALGDTTVNILNVNAGSTPPFTSLTIYDSLNLNVNIIPNRVTLLPLPPLRMWSQRVLHLFQR